MKAIGGIISAIILVIILVTAVSIMTYLMNVAYDQQLTQESYVNNFISSPKAFQVGSSSVTSDGPLVIKYVIYPNGKTDDLSQPLDGRADLSSLLNDNPWVYVVLSNGQVFNISRPQSSTSSVNSVSSTSTISTASLLRLESTYQLRASYTLEPFSSGTYQDIVFRGFNASPTTFITTELQNGETVTENYIYGNAFGDGSVAVIPVNTGNGWLNFSAEIQYGQGSVGIMFLNGSNGNGYWNAIAIGFNNNNVFEYSVMEPGFPWEFAWEWDVRIWDTVTWNLGIPPFPYYPTATYYTFVASNTPSGSPYVNLRIAIHFQEGQPAELYVWALNGSQWVPVYMQSYVPNVVGDAGISIIYAVGRIPPSQWSWAVWYGIYTVGGANESLITTSFPAYVYTINPYYNYTIEGPYPCWWCGNQEFFVHKTWYLAPIDLVPGSNVIIVPRSSGTLVYNVTSTI